MGILRLFLAILVIVTHLNGNLLNIETLPGGTCVEVFFVISGYYMCFILSNKKYASNISFYLGRIFRLYPLFLFIGLASLLKIFLFETIMGKEVMTGLTYKYSPSWLRLSADLSNLTMFGQDIFSLFHINDSKDIQFFHSNETGGTDSLGYSWGGELRWNGPAWSVGAEIWFYLLAPVLCKLKNSYLIAIVFVSILLKLSIEIFFDYSTYFLFPAQLYLFVLGILCYRYRPQNIKLKSLNFILTFAIVLFLAIYMYTPSNPILRFIIPLLVCLNLNFIFTRTSKLKWDRFLGELSYPIYISHMIIIATFTRINDHFGAMENSLTDVLLSLIMVIIFSLIWNNYVEVLINKFRMKNFVNSKHPS